MAEAFDSWGVVEVMGHQTYAGRVTEQTVGGQAFVRVDVPAVGETPAFTKLFGSGSIYCITPTSEDVARRMAAQVIKTPVYLYDVPSTRRLAQADAEPDEDEEAWHR